MRLLRRYFLKEFFKFFILSLLSLTVVFLLVEFFDKVDEFYPRRPPIYLVIWYLLLLAPKFLLFASPMAALLSILLILGMATKWKEIVAIKASGGSLKKLFSSFLILGIVVTFATLILGETIAPMASRKASYIRNVKILKKTPKSTFKEGALWLIGLDSSLIHIKAFAGDEERASEVSIFRFGKDFRIKQRIEASEAVWTGEKWILNDVIIFDLNSGNTTKHKSLPFPFLEEPKIFKEELKKQDEMNFIELYSYYKRLESAGFKNLRYLVDLYGKLAYPTINFVMFIFGVALALSGTGTGGGLRAAGLGIAISLLYWLIYSISMSLGYAGKLPPWFAPWVGPVVFGAAGIYTFSKIRE
ncbi:MAG: LptF/LptG family permease [Nitrospirae bacterium]|nr:LptF/LptG family permease [Nitrospirota bacterium]